MVEQMIKAFIIQGCCADTLRYKEYLFSKYNSLNEEEIKNQWSYITELMIVTIKSLVPSKHLVGTVVDYKRFQQELKLWNQYRHGSNNLVLNSLNNSITDNYWIDTDESIYARIFPIVVSNTRWDIIKDEIIKNLLYTTGNISDILETLILSKLLFFVMENMKDYNEIISNLKEETIHFSQKEFLERYDRNLMINLETYPGNYTIDFERKKIMLINILNGTFINDDFQVLRNTLNILKSKINNNIEISSFWIMGFKSLIEDIKIDFNFKHMTFVESLGGYLFKLRRGRVTPETLEISNYELPDIFSFAVGDKFNHTLLNRCKVIKKEKNANFIISYIQTKTGVYRFFKRVN